MLFSALGYFAALLSKESAITFLAVYPLVIYFFSERSIARSFSSSAFMLAPAVIFLLIRYSVVGETGPPSMADNALLATKDVLVQKSSAIYILGLYLLKLFYPHPLTFDYSYNQIPFVDWTSVYPILSFLIHLALLVYAVLKIKEKSLIAYGIFFYFITISIVANLVFNIGTPMAERFIYLSSFGFCLSVAALGQKVFKIRNSIKDKIQWKPVWVIPLLLIAIAASVQIINRNKDWENNYTLYKADVEKFRVVPVSVYITVLN